MNELNAVDQWIEKYEALTDEDRFEFVKETFQDELSSELVEEADLGEVLISLKSYLIDRDRITEFIALVDKFNEKNSDFYDKMAPYLHSEIISYYLLKDDIDKVQHYLQPFLKNPDYGIDEFLLIFKRIIYYGNSRLLLETAEICWKPVAYSTKIIGGVHEFLTVIYYSLWEEIYNQLRLGKAVDAYKFLEHFKKYGFEITISEVEGIIDSLKPHNTNLIIDFSTDNKRRDTIKNLRSSFIDYAVSIKNMNFITAACIFDLGIFFWEGRELKGKALKEPESYFSIDIKQFHEYLSDDFGGFVYEDIAGKCAVIWGMPYIYEFLKGNGIISNSLLETVIKQMNTLKASFKREVELSLWEHCFVHRWCKPNYISEEAFKEEAKYFEDTLHTIVKGQVNELSMFSFGRTDDEPFNMGLRQRIISPSKSINKKKEKAKKKAAKQQKMKNRKR